MDRATINDGLQSLRVHIPTSTGLVYGILALYIAHQALIYFDYPLLSPQELVWNALVYGVPARLLLDAEKRQQLKDTGVKSQMQAAKSEALRRMLGWGSNTLSHKLVGGEGLIRRISMGVSLSSDEPTTDAPPGLGNWDNSCYQNSVLQSLASLGSLKWYLERISAGLQDDGTTSASLRETVAKLNDAANNGRQLWTPAKLKSMSSWQQQDAQEYYSKITDELDKEGARAVVAGKAKDGLESVVHNAESVEAEVDEATEPGETGTEVARNPLDGLVAQRVACTQCGFSEGLSMIPFNCLTLPLGSDNVHTLDDCLDEYTKLEEISDVDCPKCTLLRAAKQIKQMIATEPSLNDKEVITEGTPNSSLSLPPELRVLAANRLRTIQHALDTDDFADKTLNDTCLIPKKAHVSSTKTRQAVIGRAPQSLAVHINRSVFDELTGVQRKNYAHVRFPMSLDLGQWMLGEGLSGQATRSMLEDSRGEECALRLKAVVTHYGRHENGHYICYRRHPLRPKAESDIDEVDEVESVREQWWRLSDEDVSAVAEEDVLEQGGVFMLFYEREGLMETPGKAISGTARIAECGTAGAETVDTALPDTAAGSVTPLAATNERLEAEVEQEAPATVNVPPSSTHPERPESSAEPSTHTAPAAPDYNIVESSSAPTASTHSSLDQPAARPEPQPAEHDFVETPPRKLPSPPLMRTSRDGQSGRQRSMGNTGFGGGLRFVTAS
ncbi:ubiquitin-specific protease ubp1 [Teratosphaeriaceae sp. CCFEE 6253]|nr:ubiquitin-specific protease ubp1 [Teratosphaeriaceae sp. CCFEE 6253]